MDQTTITQIDFSVVRPASSPVHIALNVGGMTCHRCPPMIGEALEEIRGVYAAQVILPTEIAGIGHCPSRTTDGDITKTHRSECEGVDTAETRSRIKNMRCAFCSTSNMHKIGGHPNAIANR